MKRENFDKARELVNKIDDCDEIIKQIDKKETVISFHQELCCRIGRDAADAFNEEVRDKMRELVMERKTKLEKQLKEL